MIKAKSAQEFIDCFMRGDDATYRNLHIDLTTPRTIYYNHRHVISLEDEDDGDGHKPELEIFANFKEYAMFNTVAAILNIPLQLSLHDRREFENPWGKFVAAWLDPNIESLFGINILKLVTYTGES